MMQRWILGLLLLSSTLVDAAINGGGAVPGTAFHRYSAKDQLGRTITFYLSDSSTERSIPLLVFVQGTGCSSLFQRQSGRIMQGASVLLLNVTRGRARVLIVEKPGVQFLDKQADAEDAKTCRPEFLAEHTLDRWTEAIVASIKVAHELPGIDGSKTLVIGGSEGGVVAVHVTNVMPSVTYAASIAGGGPNHLFVLADYVRRSGLDPEVEVYGCWARILRDPDSTTEFCWGQPYRLWSSLLKTSLTQECLQSRAALYLVHGTADEWSSIAAFDVMRAELAAKQRKAVFERIEGADHSLTQPGESPGEGLSAAFGRIVDWFLGGAH
jgi:pimeloyl-ACP methyl ester carboxylesterase